MKDDYQLLTLLPARHEGQALEQVDILLVLGQSLHSNPQASAVLHFVGFP